MLNSIVVKGFRVYLMTTYQFLPKYDPLECACRFKDPTPLIFVGWKIAFRSTYENTFRLLMFFPSEIVKQITIINLSWLQAWDLSSSSAICAESFGQIMSPFAMLGR